jgi:hypothetical protein
LRAAAIAGIVALVAAVALGLRLLSPASGTEPLSGGGQTTGNLPPATLRTTPPQPPPSAEPATVDAAKAFARHWFEAVNYAIGTGDTSAVEAASSPSCETCTQLVTFVRDAYANGGSLRGGGYTVRDVTTDDFWSLENAKLGAVFDRSARSKVAADGTQSDVLEGAPFLTCQMLLERVDNHWRVREAHSTTRLF